MQASIPFLIAFHKFPLSGGSYAVALAPSSLFTSVHSNGPAIMPVGEP
jgi:hypothetical protein